MDRLNHPCLGKPEALIVQNLPLPIKKGSLTFLELINNLVSMMVPLDKRELFGGDDQADSQQILAITSRLVKADVGIRLLAGRRPLREFDMPSIIASADTAAKPVNVAFRQVFSRAQMPHVEGPLSDAALGLVGLHQVLLWPNDFFTYKDHGAKLTQPPLQTAVAQFTAKVLTPLARR